MEFEEQFVFILALLELLTAVLLVADDGLQPALGEVEGVVPDGLVVLDLLERQGLLVSVK